jgi:hypothetical protein
MHEAPRSYPPHYVAKLCWKTHTQTPPRHTLALKWPVCWQALSVSLKATTLGNNFPRLVDSTVKDTLTVKDLPCFRMIIIASCHS